MSKRKTPKTSQPAATAHIKSHEHETLTHSNASNGEERTTTVPSGTAYAVGAMLRQARQEKDKSIHEVANAINIRVSQVQALEDENLAQLPGMTYALGFLRSYANHLGLDAEDVVRRFKQAHQREMSEKKELVFPVPASEALMPGSRVVWVSVVLFLAAVVAAGVLYVPRSADIDIIAEPSAAEVVPPAADTLVPGLSSDLSSNPAASLVPGLLPPAFPVTTPGADPTLAGATTPVTPAVPGAMEIPVAESAETLTLTSSGQATTAGPEAPPAAALATPVSPAADGIQETQTVVMQPAATPETPAPAPVPPVKPEERKLTAPKKGAGRIEIRARENSWIQVTDAKGKTVVRKVLRPGDVYSVPDQPGLELVTANAGGLEIMVDGAAVKPIGKSGAIVRGVNLNPDKLKKR